MNHVDSLLKVGQTKDKLCVYYVVFKGNGMLFVVTQTELVWLEYHVSWPAGELGGTILLFLVGVRLMFGITTICSL